ncbi:MAG: nucleoside triphosphate pyrophosphohydrolase [Candidatus Parcubacteria bacterium]|nr:nucleoside triphosphate pyrophosphohydrolase [Candidatus Parcubacteria bacterium]
MIYHKLVRDKIPEHILKTGRTPVTHIADEEEYWKKLKEKLNEEVTEFQQDENIEELADILEVIGAIIQYKHFSPSELSEVKKNKAEDRGRFTKRIILDES